MDRNVKRARDLLPVVVTTVLSMIQALALELYWGKIGDSDFLWQGGWTAAIGWLQLLVMFIGILQIWLYYVSVVLRFSWLPTMADTVLPFFIGLLEFGMIGLLGDEHLGPWFLLLASIFAVTIGTNHVTMRNARRDPDNDYFFRNFEPARLRDFAPSIAIIAVLALMGVLLWVFDNPHALSLVALLLAIAALAYQLRQTHRYWIYSEVSAD